jgi:arabinan endo-1,5-alpha-L-arabinosidase
MTDSRSTRFRGAGFSARTGLVIALLAIFLLPSCGGGTGYAPGGPGGGSGGAPTVFSNYHLTGLTTPVRDPSIAFQNGTYYVFSTDAGLPGSQSLPILCSTDRVAWKQCGAVFLQIPAWVHQQVPLATGLWAPDISFFNGLYHVYYAASSFASNTSGIGLATNTTLDPTDPNYQWVDQGEVFGSSPADDFNAIDPTILIDTDGSVWMTYGSFWSGIKQRQIDPTTGMLGSDSTIYSLATRPDVQYDPIEGSSLVHKGTYYYLFVSFDSCCNSDPYLTTYRIMVGRGTSAHGPFVDERGVDMMLGGGTQLLAGNGQTWNAPGGETVLIDPVNGDLITFHAIQLPDGGAYLFVNSLTWPDDWPQIQP